MLAINKLIYKQGDVIKSSKESAQEGKHIIIPHVCNCKGKWGAGFVRAISNEWDKPEKDYKKFYNKFLQDKNAIDDKKLLGKVGFSRVEKNIIIANMIAQTMYKGIPLYYSALMVCMHKIMKFIKSNDNDMIIYAPKFGAGLAGGDWRFIEKLIQEIWIENEIDVTIFNYKRE